jgi:hypothetical protein|tara:strand:+ start:291 stop:521 length:231 start_codon:yes stop_codon:yes gene_type:complete
MNYYYILMVYTNFNRRDLMFIGKFNHFNDISRFTNNKITYLDRFLDRKDHKYKTFKRLFNVVKIYKKDYNIFVDNK